MNSYALAGVVIVLAALAACLAGGAVVWLASRRAEDELRRESQRLREESARLRTSTNLLLLALERAGLIQVTLGPDNEVLGVNVAVRPEHVRRPSTGAPTATPGGATRGRAGNAAYLRQLLDQIAELHAELMAVELVRAWEGRGAATGPAQPERPPWWRRWP